MEKHFRQVGVSAEAVHEVLVEGGQKDHFEYTAGAIKTKTLRRMGHPFARNGNAARGIVGSQSKLKSFGKAKGQIHGRGVRPLPINIQTGKLRASFYRTNVKGKDLVVKMGFRMPYARFVLSPTGTKKMIARGFYSNGGQFGIIKKRHKFRLAVAKKVYRETIKK